MLEVRGVEVEVRADPSQRCNTLFDDIWIWFLLLHSPTCCDTLADEHPSQTPCKRLRLGVDVFVAGHLPALVVPVHDFKLFPQPPTAGGTERKTNTRLKEQILQELK